MPLAEIEEFLESTYDAVPVGEEDQWLEVDTALDQILKAG
jgi:hypothetical protein